MAIAKYYDKKNQRLVCVGESSPGFWDRQWEIDEFKKKVKNLGAKDSFVTNYTKKYLKSGSKILEGGCGIGHYVCALERLGYEAYGIDYAKNTVDKINNHFPDLKVYYQDVRKVGFSDNFFDGYWSLGLIEHFWQGFDAVASEMKRVIRPGGFLFITFPQMNLLRKIKARLGIYKEYELKDFNQDSFYQYILDEKIINKIFGEMGFELVFKTSLDAVRGMRDELSLPDFFYSSNNFFVRVLRFGINKIFNFFSGHIVLLVLKNNK
jgi:SAM-dependent methyltransferase